MLITISIPSKNNTINCKRHERLYQYKIINKVPEDTYIVTMDVKSLRYTYN